MMLADVGPATPDDLVKHAIKEENLLETIAELRKFDLLLVKCKKVVLTEEGVAVVRALRKKP